MNKKPPTPNDDRNIRRHPTRAVAYFGCIRVPDLTCSPEQESIVQQLALLEAGADAGNAPCAPLNFSPALPRANLVVLLCKILEGAKWKGALKASGLSYAQVNICKLADPDGFGRYLELAERVKADIDRDTMRDALMERAVEGVESPLIGRVGKDEDGVVATVRKPSDRLLEFAMRNRDSEYKDVRGAPANTNTGTQIQLNVWIPPHLAAEAAAPAPTSAFDGGKRAETDYEDIET